MEKQEIEMGHSLFADQGFMMAHEEMEDDPDAIAAENTDDSNHDDHKLGAPLREQDRFLPIANVAKIMKRAIPETGKVSSTNKIAKDARECVQECVSEFISFITSEASERCHTEKRKTINGEDILYAMHALGFDNYIEPLKLYLQKFREASKTDKNLQTTDLNYEEIDESFNFKTVSTDHTLLPDTGSGETVIYTYQDNNLHQFQLG